jgi:non-heme Fe2+,alpha-ketoglutarate-dependent halogenase
MRVIPGSHTADQLPHRDTFGPNNLLTRGQEVAVEVDESKAVDVVLAAGQFSLHHVRLVHGSKPNTSNGPRIGFAIRYLPTYVRQVSGNPDSATLVRGEDEYGHFLLEPAPQSDFHPDAVAFHARVMEANRKILYGR